MELSTVLKQLKKLGNPEVIKIKKRFGIAPVYSYGIFLKDLKELAKRIGKNELVRERSGSGHITGDIFRNGNVFGLFIS